MFSLQKGLMRQLNSEKIISNSIQENNLLKQHAFASYIKQQTKNSLSKNGKRLLSLIYASSPALQSQF